MGQSLEHMEQTVRNLAAYIEQTGDDSAVANFFQTLLHAGKVRPLKQPLAKRNRVIGAIALVAVENVDIKLQKVLCVKFPIVLSFNIFIDLHIIPPVVTGST